MTPPQVSARAAAERGIVTRARKVVEIWSARSHPRAVLPQLSAESAICQACPAQERIGAICTLGARTAAKGWQRTSIVAEPRSAYLLRGPARTDWEHSILAVGGL